MSAAVYQARARVAGLSRYREPSDSDLLLARRALAVALATQAAEQCLALVREARTP